MLDIACPTCGAPNPETNRFCGSCGASVARACPACGADNPPANRFCGSCGSSFGGGTAALVVEERKVVTILFADLTASTEMASRLDPEDLRAVLEPYFAAMAQEVDRFGGTVEKFIGDAVVAVFGAPVAHEDDPERAVRCALAMHGRLSELNPELAVRAGGDLTMRIGVNTGEVITHAGDEGIVTGRAVNVAARFQTLAEPGGVVVGERTHRDTRGAFVFTDLGVVSVKGIDRPLSLWRVEAESTRAAPTGVATPFVGRESESQLLRLLFDRTAAEGRPNLVTIVGPPGIGKSRLSQELARSLGEGVVRVVRGRCLPYGDGLTYWPLAEVLKSDLGVLDSDEPAAILGKARAGLDPRFPGDEGLGVAAVLLSSVGVEVPSDPLAGTDPEAAHRLISRAWQRYLESLTARGPVLALIEDIHWGDPSLLRLIENVVARATGPALILCMARPDLFEARPDWGGGLSNASTISLSPLSSGDGTMLIHHLLGDDAPAEVVGAILHRSEGNPFFAGELLRMMIEDGTLARSDARWRLVRELPGSLPDTVQGVIASRIDMLPPSQKRVVQDASVVGRLFWRGAVERLGGTDVDEALDRLVEKGLVWERDDSSIAGERELTFNHILTRDVAHASIPRSRRAEAHSTVGEWIEETTRGRAEEFAEILAYHFGLAGDDDRAARYGFLAGNRHLRMFAAEQAIRWYDRALEAVHKDAASRSRICLARGGALEQIGRFEEARDAYDESIASAAESGDVELEARPLAAKAHVLWLLDRYDEGQSLLPLALERARAVGLSDVEARLLYTAGTIRFGRGEFGEALPLHRQALEHGLSADRLLRDLEQRSMVAHNGYMVSWAMSFLGRVGEAEATVQASIDTSHEIGNRREEAFALLCRAQIALMTGRLDDAWRDGEAGRDLFRELGLLRGQIVGCNVLADIAAEAGHADRLIASAREGLDASEVLRSAFHRAAVVAFAGLAAAASGDSEEADRRFAGVRTLDGAAFGVAWAGKAEVMAREVASDPAGLRSTADRLDTLPAPGSRRWGSWGGYARALAALQEDRPEEALESALEARTWAAEAGERTVAWRAGRVAWRALLALERRDEAEARRAEAASIARREADGASGTLREAFLTRPDVAELLG